jgi:predicted ribosome quality control (RQC) complex YloA/Tae2 family protein
MFMRKYLTNATLDSIYQPESERIVFMDFKKADEKYILVVELFSKGNVILLKENRIVQPLSVQRWKDRTIRAKELYKLPPSKMNLMKLTFTEFSKTVRASEKEDIVRALAVDIGLGGPYAEECCARAKVDKNSDIPQLSATDFKTLFESFKSMLKSLDEPIGIVYMENRPVHVAPFEMEIHKNSQSKRFSTFNEALDFYFTEFYMKSDEFKAVSCKEDKVTTIRKRIQRQEELVEEFRKKAEYDRAKAEIISSHIELIKRISRLILAARDQYPWERVIEIIESEKTKGIYEAGVISEIRPDVGTVFLDLDGGIEMDITRDVSDQMQELYDSAKKHEQKIVNAREAISQSRSELEKIRKKPIEIKKPKKIVKTKKEWYERFLWFHSSEGFLVISGKDATQNEVIIKKHLEVDDLVFHTEIRGSPFTIVKGGRECGSKTKTEASQNTVAYSKAWSENISADTFYVKPQQVTKQAPAGEYIQKGAFIIRGKKEFIKNLKPELAIGISDELKVIAGPRTAISKQTSQYIKLIPGDTPTGDTAKAVKESLVKMVPAAEKIPLESFQTFIPGKSEIR